MVSNVVNDVEFRGLNGASKLAKSDFFDLADAFARDGEFLTNAFKSASRFVVEAEALNNDIFFFVAENKEHFFDNFGEVDASSRLVGSHKKFRSLFLLS